MKFVDFGLVAILAIFIFFSISDYRVSSLEAAETQEETVQNYLDTATLCSVQTIAQEELDTDVFENKGKVLNDFFNTLYASYGINGNASKERFLQSYVPAVALVDNSGVNISYCETYKDNGTLYLDRCWSQKYSYVYSEDDYVYTFSLGDYQRVLKLSTSEYCRGTYAQIAKKFPDCKLATFKDSESFNEFKDQVIIDTINDKLTYFINKHNMVALQGDTNFAFSMPTLDANSWMSLISSPSIMAVYEGRALGYATTDIYPVTAVSIAKVAIIGNYYAFPDKNSGIYYYHKKSCPELKEYMKEHPDKTLADLDHYLTKEDAAHNGNYACSTCNP